MTWALDCSIKLNFQGPQKDLFIVDVRTFFENPDLFCHLDDELIKNICYWWN